jgi:hypothetical protein
VIRQTPGEIIIVPYGVGANSTALLVELTERGDHPDLIIFADTGAERDQTYRYLGWFDAWLTRRGSPGITIVRYRTLEGRHRTLEQECTEERKLPGAVYGSNSCSEKHKQRPQNKFLRSWPPAIAEWKAKRKLVKLIAYDAGELHRAQFYPNTMYEQRYPLIDWRWFREDCDRRIRAAGLPLPGKSSCYYCPNMGDGEILDLRAQEPGNFEKALQLERNAQLVTIKGLARDFSWSQIVEYHDAQIPIVRAERQQCGHCYDGGPSDE